MINVSFNSLRFRTRWFCYLDLLGFTAKVESDTVADIIPLYQSIVARLREKVGLKKGKGIIHSWFSDSFIIYTRDDSEQEFAILESVCRAFFQELIIKGVPLRGAITHGRLYSQSKLNIFVGPALIDAYMYAEKQAWVGFVLTPSVRDRLAGTALDLSRRAHYRLVTEPGIIRYEPSSPVYAFAFNNGAINGRNPYVSALEGLRNEAPEHAKSKYDLTLAFIRKHMHQAPPRAAELGVAANREA